MINFDFENDFDKKRRKTVKVDHLKLIQEYN